MEPKKKNTFDLIIWSEMIRAIYYTYNYKHSISRAFHYSLYPILHRIGG